MLYLNKQSLSIPLPPSPRQPQSAFCRFGFVYSGRCISMEANNTCPFVSGFFPLASSFQGSSIHTVACVRASFLCLAESCPLYGYHCMERPHPRVHSSGDRNLCCFHLLAFMDDVAISFCVDTFSFLFDVHLGVQLLGHRLTLYPNF